VTDTAALKLHVPPEDAPAGAGGQSGAALALGLGSTAELAQLLREFVAHLTDLQAALTELTQLAGRKLAGIRRADSAALQEIAAREGSLLAGVFRREQARRAVLAQLAQHLQCADEEHVCLAAIAERVAEPLRSALRARSAALRQTTLELQRKNRLAADVARSLQTHLRGIFADVAGVSRETLGYGPQGRQAVTSARSWVEAVG
jgi:hypothetical protein